MITVSKASMNPNNNGEIDLEVDYTTAKEVDGLKGLGKKIMLLILIVLLLF